MQDRLFKIRHSENIEGIVRQLALFQSPIDPRQLIRALTAGQDIARVAETLSVPVPHYRFTAVARAGEERHIHAVPARFFPAQRSGEKGRGAAQPGAFHA